MLSSQLYDDLKDFHRNVKMITSYYEADDEIPVKCDSSQRVKVVYPTSRSEDDPLLKIIAPALAEIAREFCDQVEIFILGPRALPQDLLTQKNIQLVGFQSNYEAFRKSFVSSGYEIGLAPMLDDEFHNSKTNNKYREFGGAGIAGIYSDTPVYRHCITDMSNGLLVENSKESWKDALKHLISNPSLRSNISSKAHRDILENYTIDQYSFTLLSDIQTALASIQPGKAVAQFNQYNFELAWNSLYWEIPEARLLREQIGAALTDISGRATIYTQDYGQSLPSDHLKITARWLGVGSSVEMHLYSKGRDLFLCQPSNHPRSFKLPNGFLTPTEGTYAFYTNNFLIGLLRKMNEIMVENNCYQNGIHFSQLPPMSPIDAKLRKIHNVLFKLVKVPLRNSWHLSLRLGRAAKKLYVFLARDYWTFKRKIRLLRDLNQN